MQKLRNIAIIAHVDHGKTTLVDKMILAGNILRDNAKQTGELILDNNDLERERGITILSKNVSVIYKDYKINIIDTPGHADFGGEVERVLNMCDGVLLLVDAFEGTMPQTRFVLQKALALGKKPIVVINKVDKPNCRPEVVNEQVFDLMFTLDATEEQLDYKTIYGSAKQGWMSHKWNEPTDSLVPLLDAIIDEIPEPAVVEGTPQMLITSLEYSSYTGRIAVGKVTRGSLRAGQNVTLAKRDGATMQKTRIKDLMVFEGLGKKKVDEVPCGEICAIMGIEGFEIGDTICDYENPEPLPPIAIDEPTMSMLFTINNSPFFGKDGKYVTSRHIKERLDRELEKNLALRVTPSAVRAAVMCTMLQFALASASEYVALNALAAAGFGMLLWNPAWLGDISFQLSFIAVAAILAWGVPLCRLLHTRRRALNLLTDALVISLVAGIATAPLVSHTFGTVPLAGLLVNPVAILVGSIVVLGGTVWMILPVNWLAPAFDAVLSGTAGLLNTLARAAAALPGGYAEYTLGGGATAGIYLFFLLTTLAAWSFEPKKSVHLPA